MLLFLYFHFFTKASPPIFTHFCCHEQEPRDEKQLLYKIVCLVYVTIKAFSLKYIVPLALPQHQVLLFNNVPVHRQLRNTSLQTSYQASWLCLKRWFISLTIAVIFQGAFTVLSWFCAFPVVILAVWLDSFKLNAFLKAALAEGQSSTAHSVNSHVKDYLIARLAVVH